MRDLETGHDRGLRFDRKAAQHALDFFSFLSHSRGQWAGSTFVLEDWQRFIVASLFGWKRQDGFRRFRIGYVEAPRKSGKTQLAAAIGIYLFYADREPASEVYVCATKKDQAKITWDEAERMVRSSPALKGRIGVFRNNLHVEATASKFEPLGADADTLDGLNVHGAIIDELHAHPNRGVWDALRTATSARRQPLLFAITTAGYDRETICWEVHDYSTRVLEGALEDDARFAYIATLDEGDDWRDEGVWCLSGATEVYARLPKGETVTTVQALSEDLNAEKAELWDGREWVRVLGASKSPPDAVRLQIELRSGERIGCTGHHEWPTQRGKVRADELRSGDIIATTTLPDNQLPASSLIPPEVGWLIGLYLAEGSPSGQRPSKRAGGGSRRQFSGNIDENAARLRLIGKVVAAYGGTCHAHSDGKRGTVIVESAVVASIIDQYVGGKTAHDKYLRPATWRRSNAFLRALAAGYMHGDGHFDEQNQRYRLGFCRNYRLADGLRTLGARLGARVTLRTAFTTDGGGGRHPTFRGEWLFNGAHGSRMNSGEVVSVKKSSARQFWHIGVDNADGLFALSSGVLTHNSKANPNLGVSVRLDDVRELAREARESPAAQNTFRRLRLNEWTEQAERAIDMDDWRACGEHRVDPESLRGETCFAGLDLSSTTDLTALVLFFPSEEGEPSPALPYFWMPDDNIARRERADGVPFTAWKRDEHLFATEGNIVDYAAVRAQLNRLAEIYRIVEVAYDPWNATGLATQLEGDGFVVVPFRQGWQSMNEPTKELLKLVAGRKLAHGNHPVLRWMASNLALLQDPAGNLKPAKNKSKDRIDGMVALIMAVGRAMVHPEPVLSRYEQEGAEIYVV